MEDLESLLQYYLTEYRKGTCISVEEFAMKYPQYTKDLMDLLPTILFMEKRNFDTPAPKDLDSNEIPERVHQYRILRKLGQGGMGIVYEAEHEMTKLRVAIKFLKAKQMENENAVQRFQREIRTATAMHYKNIAPVLGSSSINKQLYYVMKYIDGLSIDRVFSRFLVRQIISDDDLLLGNPLPDRDSAFFSNSEIIDNFSLDQFLFNLNNRQAFDFKSPTDWYKAVCQIGIQVCEALQYAHNLHVLHRDIKPSNLILDNSGIVWVTDFGLAKPIFDSEITATGQSIGTLRYMAPESVDGLFMPQSDIYSLGVTLYELIARKSAYDDSSYSQLVENVVNASITPLRKIDPRIPFNLETIILKATDRSPEKRYRTAEDFAVDLRNFIHDRPVLAQRPNRDLLKKWCAEHKIQASAALIAFIFVLVYSIFISIQSIHTGRNLAINQTLLETTENEVKRADANLNIALSIFDDIFAIYQGIENNNHFFYAEFEHPLTPSPAETSLSQNEIAAFEAILKFYDQFIAVNDNIPELQVGCAIAYCRIAFIRQVAGDEDEAWIACQRSKNFFDKGIKFSKNPEKDTLNYISFLIKYFRQITENPNLDPYFREFIDDLLKAVIAIPDNRNFRQPRCLEIAALYRLKAAFLINSAYKDGNFISGHYDITADIPKKIEYFKKNYANLMQEVDELLIESQKYSNTLLKEFPASESTLGCLAWHYSARGLYYCVSGETQKGYEFNIKAIQTAEQLLKLNPDNPRNRALFSRLLIRFVFISRTDSSDNGKKIQRQVIDRAIHAAEELHNKYPESGAYASSYFIALFARATTCHFWKENQLAEEYYRDALEKYNLFQTQHISFSAANYYIPLHFSLASLLIDNKKFEEAKKHLDDLDRYFVIKKNDSIALRKKWGDRIIRLKKKIELQKNSTNKNTTSKTTNTSGK